MRWEKGGRKGELRRVNGRTTGKDLLGDMKERRKTMGDAPRFWGR